jgi:hypothetical protein
MMRRFLRKVHMPETEPPPQAKPAREQTSERPGWPPTREYFENRLHHALAGADDVEYRMNLGIQCWTFMLRVWQRRTNAHDARTKWNPVRYAGAVIPVVAAGAGGSLVSHVHGTVGTAIGWVALLGGILGAAINAVRPAAEYGVDMTKAAQFEQLYWDVYNYAMAELPADAPERIAAILRDFSERMEKIAILSGAATATSS